jgi:hypothetical protein
MKSNQEIVIKIQKNDTEKNNSILEKIRKKINRFGVRMRKKNSLQVLSAD